MDLEFELTGQHVTLLRNAYVGWDDCEFGAPAINCKRPYGNSDVLTDIAKLLHPEFTAMREGAQMDWMEDNADRLRAVHEETQNALQIVLVTGQMQPGRYVRSSAYDRDWQREEQGLMAELNIPDEVRAAGFTAFATAVQGGFDGPQIYAQTIAAVAPLIVAVELGVLADEMAMRTVTEEDVRARIAQLAGRSDTWCNCQAVHGTVNYPGPWHPTGDTPTCRPRAAELRSEASQ